MLRKLHEHENKRDNSIIQYPFNISSIKYSNVCQFHIFFQTKVKNIEYKYYTLFMALNDLDKAFNKNYCQIILEKV